MPLPTSRWWMSPASRSARQWWVRVDVATGRAKEAQGRSASSGFGVVTLTNSVADVAEDQLRNAFVAREGRVPLPAGPAATVTGAGLDAVAGELITMSR